MPLSLHLASFLLFRPRLYRKLKGISDSTIKHDHAALSSTTMELGLETLGADLLALRERRKSEGERNVAHAENQAQVHREGEARVSAQPLGALEPDEDERRHDHDRGAIENTTQCRLAHGYRCGPAALAQRGHVALRPALSRQLCLVGGGQDRVHVDADAHLLAAHEQYVEEPGRRDSGERHEAAEDQLCRGRHALEARDKRVQPHGDGTRGADGEEVGLRELRVRERRRFVRVGVVYGDVEGLVRDLPEDGAGVLRRATRLAWALLDTRPGCFWGETENRPSRGERVPTDPA